MNEIILIMLFVCGKVDTVIVKYPKEDKAIYTRQFDNPQFVEELSRIMKTKPVIIGYEDDRGICI